MSVNSDEIKAAPKNSRTADSYLSASDSFGNYRTSRARVEIKIISTSTGDVIWADSTYAEENTVLKNTVLIFDRY